MISVWFKPCRAVCFIEMRVCTQNFSMIERLVFVENSCNVHCSHLRKGRTGWNYSKHHLCFRVSFQGFYMWQSHMGYLATAPHAFHKGYLITAQRIFLKSLLCPSSPWDGCYGVLLSSGWTKPNGKRTWNPFCMQSFQ